MWTRTIMIMYKKKYTSLETFFPTRCDIKCLSDDLLSFWNKNASRI